MDLENKSKDELINELVYLRDIVESYDKTDSKNIQHGIAKLDVQNILHNIIEHLPAHVYVKDRDHRFIMANEATAKHMGASSARDLLGKTDYDFYPKKMADEFRADEEKIMNSGKPIIDKDEPSKKSNGDMEWILTTKTPMRSPEGSITGIIGVGQIISKRKKVEDERNVVIADLKQALMDVKTLSGLLPICANCKKIRDDGGYWHKLELYLNDKTHAELTHGICPDCAKATLDEFECSKNTDGTA